MSINILSISDRRPENTVEPLRIASSSGFHIDLSSNGLFERILSLLAICGKKSVRQNTDIILLDGGGAIAIIMYIFSKVIRKQLIFRLGGNPYTVERSELDDLISESEYLSAIYYYLFYISTISVLEHADGVITVSDSLKKEISEDANIEADKIEVVNVPISSNFIQRSEPYNNDSLTITTVTNLGFRKKYAGVQRSLEILRPILEEKNGVEYMIVGGGRYYTQLESYVEENLENISEKISLAGFQKDVAQSYANSDVFFYVSYADSYPNVILEAMSSALPVIANNSFGMREQVTHDETGYLFDVSETEIARTHVRELLENRQLRAQFGDNGLEKVVGRNANLKIGNDFISSMTSLYSRHC
ncbi:glycosyltransferase family 4 protein [Halococcus qingdaonensis]|uniref:glycosyltransferase family 4 protein n=1 Tax=Halococcus qingdaonensis TaxID=224402 RepID=UPI0021160D80|nr:glycosyltransferase family 4 protein [Halococcus qingdaonensis]